MKPSPTRVAFRSLTAGRGIDQVQREVEYLFREGDSLIKELRGFGLKFGADMHVPDAQAILDGFQPHPLQVQVTGDEGHRQAGQAGRGQREQASSPVGGVHFQFHCVP